MFFSRTRGTSLPPGVKPNGVPRIDWLHPMAQGLVFCSFDTGEGDVVDLVGGQHAVLSGTVPSPTVTQWGQGFACNASLNATFKIPRILLAALNTPQAWTFCSVYTNYSAAVNKQTARYNIASQGSAFFQTSVNVGGAGSNKNMFWTVQGGQTDAGAFNAASFGANTNWNTGLSVSWCVYRGDATNVIEGRNMWGGGGVRNANQAWAGNYPSTTDGGGTQGNNTTRRTDFNITNDTYIIYNTMSAGYVFMSCVWSRRVFLTEMVSFASDPYSFLSPPRVELGVEFLKPRSVILPVGAYCDSGTPTIPFGL